MSTISKLHQRATRVNTRSEAFNSRTFGVFRWIKISEIQTLKFVNCHLQKSNGNFIIIISRLNSLYMCNNYLTRWMLEKVIKNKNITIETRNRILQCYVIPILTYGSECWTISPNMERKLEATEMWFHRRMLHISWKDHVTNDEVLRRGRTERKLMNRIRAGQMSFLGHIIRKHGLENIVVTGKIEGERSRGRPRLNFMKSLSQLLKIQWSRDHRKNKKQGRVENHDRQRPNWIRHLEGEIERMLDNWYWSTN